MSGFFRRSCCSILGNRDGVHVQRGLHLGKEYSAFPKHLSERAGLLLPHGVGVYSFPHRSFQEFLAACYLSKQDDYPDNIAELACIEPNRWREVLLLAAARFPDVALMLWSLVEALCYENVSSCENDSPQAWGALLAGQVLLENADLNSISRRHQGKVTRIKEWLVAILTEQAPKTEPFPATERALAGNVLAKLGDPRAGVGLRENGLPDIAWREVPEGTFLMGSDPAEEAPEKLLEDVAAQYEQAQETFDDDLKEIYQRTFLSEQPQHQVMLSQYSISRYPVTNAQYHVFVENDGYGEQWRTCWSEEGWAWKEQENIKRPEGYSNHAFHLSNHPVVGVSWYEASAFCAWLTLRLREAGELSETQKIRLPTGAEWEKAARGASGWIYPWGRKIDPERANYYETRLGITSAVGCFPQGKSPYDLDDMAGNVYEWCRDWYNERYYANSLAENPSGPVSGSERVVRGGTWGRFAENCRAALRDWDEPGNRTRTVGFRLLRT